MSHKLLQDVKNLHRLQLAVYSETSWHGPDLITVQADNTNLNTTQFYTTKILNSFFHTH